MFRNIYGIMVLVALQSVFSVSAGGEVHEIQVQLVNLEMVNGKGLTVIQGKEFGNEQAQPVNAANNVLVVNPINAIILGLRGIALVQSEREGGNYIVVPTELKDRFKVGSAFRYRWSCGGDVQQKDWAKTSVKIVTHFEVYGYFWKITHTALDFSLGNLDMTFGVANPGEFYKEKSNALKQEYELITATFFKLRHQYLNTTFTPEFKNDTLKEHEVLKLVRVKITGFTIYTRGKDPFVIKSMDQEVGMHHTLSHYYYGQEQPPVNVAAKDPNFTYTIVFTYLPLE